MTATKRIRKWIQSVMYVACIFVLASCSDNGSSGSLEAPDGIAEQSTSGKEDIIESEEEVFDNPVDNKTYIAPGGWKTHKPDTPRDPIEEGRIHYAGVRLLNSEEEIDSATTVNAFADLIRRIENSAQEQLDTVESGEILVQFTCSPASHVVQLAHRGNFSQEQIQAFYDDLVALEPLTVSAGEVSFQVTIKIDLQ